MTSQIWHDPALTEEQAMIRETAQKLAAEVLAPRAEASDHEARFPRDSFAAMAELGFLGLSVSEDAGGAGMGAFAYGIALHELAKGCAATARCLDAHVSRCAFVIEKFAPAALREEHLPSLAGGETVGAGVLAESDASELTWRRAGGDYLLEGRAPYVANATEAGLFAVAARGEEGVLAVFVLPRSAEGVSIVPSEISLGMRAAGWAALECRRTPLGADQCLGEGPAGEAIVAATLARERLGLSAIALGIATDAWERARRYADERSTFGKPLARHQAVALKLSDMAIRIAAARHLVFDACRRGEEDAADFPGLAAMAKVVASQCATYCSDEAIQIHGGYGYVSEYHVERGYRDGKYCEIAGGGNEACRILVGQTVLGG